VEPEAGWYQDPDGSGLRYWDGAQWTEHRQAAAQASPRVLPGAFWGLLAASVAVGIGSVGPWATNALVTAGGLDGDGWITLVMAAISAVALYQAYTSNPFQINLAPVIAGLVAAGLGIYDAVQIEDAGDTRLFGEAVDVANVGWGLYLVIAGGIGMAVLGWMLRRG
jgi:Protein of unknown function (DUF2510)